MPRCIPSSSHIFPKTINTGSLRQTISSYICFLKADHYYQKPSSLLKETKYDRNHIHIVSSRGNCVVGKMPPTSLYSSLFSFPFQQEDPCLPKGPQIPRTFMIRVSLCYLTQAHFENDFINSFQQMCK